MIIDYIDIKNFRSIREQKIIFDSFTSLLGPNGSGKSSVLSAIEIFYDISAPISEEDFFNKNVSLPIEISINFKNLKNQELTEFSSYISDNCLNVKKQITFENGNVNQKYFGATMQIPEFSVIRNLPTKSEKRTAYNELVNSGTLEGLENTARSSDIAEEQMIIFEEAHQDLRILIEREKQFIGSSNIGGGKLDKYSKFVRIPAIRELDEELGEQRGTSFYQLLDFIVMNKINSRQDIIDFQIDMETSIGELYSSENLTELSELSLQINENLRIFSPGAELILKWDTPQIPEFKLPKTIPTLIEDEYEGDISKKGHGLQRALIMTLIQLLATTQFENEPGTELDENESPEPQTFAPDLILAIDEPELFLHPNRCRYLVRLLRTLSIPSSNGEGGKNQILITTHSPFFVGLDWFDQVRSFRKIKIPPNTIPETVVNTFPLQSAIIKLAEITQKDPSIFTEESFRARSMPIMTTIINEGFFADLIVLVEGKGDFGAIWAMQKILNLEWDAKGITILPVDGKNNLDRPAVIFSGLKIPVYLIFDGDNSNSSGQDRQNHIDCNHILLNFLGVDPIDFPPTQINPTWACFDDTFETFLENDLGSQLFNEIKERVQAELGLRQNQIMKNINGSARFVEIVYELEHTLPNLERLINQITEVRNN